MLGSLSAGSAAMKGARTRWRATGRGLVKKSATLCRPRMKRTRKCPWRTQSRIQYSRMSVAFDIRWENVSAAMPIATSLSQNNGMAGWGWPMLTKILRSSVAMRAAAYKPAYSASATTEHTTVRKSKERVGLTQRELSLLEEFRWQVTREYEISQTITTKADKGWWGLEKGSSENYLG